ncbi:MAG: GAF domain-containing protein [Candidatus Acidiferrales bacterium]
MPETLVAEMDRLVREIAKQSVAPDAAAREAIAQELAKRFHVKPDEVAILALVHAGQMLRFVLPEKLRPVGTIPLNSTSALAARTAREKRAEVINNFPAVRHASVFEGVPLGREQGELIQKIMSAPIVAEKRVLGVVQVCRKGHTAGDAGSDFSSTDLKDLTSLSEALGRFLIACQET